MFNQKSILITGGTGSCGKQYVRTLLARFQRRRIIVYSRDRCGLYEPAAVREAGPGCSPIRRRCEARVGNA